MASYPVGARVWVKMPDYPWWPGFVVDAAEVQADVSLREPRQDLCVQCLPSSAPSVMFVTSANADEVRLFMGQEADKDLIAAGQAHPECAPAVAEALVVFGASEDAHTLATAGADPAGRDDTLALLMGAGDEVGQPGKSNGGSSSSDDDDAGEEDEMLLNLTGGQSKAGDADGERDAAKAERRRQRKLQKKLEKAARKKAHKDRDSKSKKAKHSRRSDDDDDIDSDDDAPRKRKKAPKSGGADPRDMRQTPLDAYGSEAARPPKLPQYTETDAEYFARKLKNRRQEASVAALAQCAEQLKAVTGGCLEDGTYEEEEDALLELLRPLAACDVTYEQLCVTGIGAVVGALLKPSFSSRVRALANGILAYWFRTLPEQVQKDLSEDSEIDHCSVETTVGTRSDGMEEALGTVGLHLFESFTDEEVYDAPPNTNVVEICKTIETELRERNDDLDTRVMVLTTIGDPANAALRRGILDGRVTPNDIVKHANDLGSVLRQVNARGLRNINTNFEASPTTPDAPFSPTGFGGGDGRSSTGSPGFSPTGGAMGTFTTLYSCPSCGAEEAYRTDYTVQAHDNFPEILRCRKCGNTWNAAE